MNRAGRDITDGEMDDTYAEFRCPGTALGDVHKRYGVCKAWPCCQNTAPPTVTAQDDTYTVVGNVFGYGLQWESWS